MSRQIPKNDNEHPRWLLNIQEWSIHPYNEVEVQIRNLGYGILSYTWGAWANYDVPADGVPKNLLWKIPSVKGLSIDHARNVLTGTMHMKYVWWDWMCVPQGKDGTEITLDDELKKVKGEEVAKQMKIYKGAKKSIVWLHHTKWEECPRLAGYLKGSLPCFTDFGDTITDFPLSIKEMQGEEPWLTSGWTLQEGVLLENAPVIDYEGKGLSGDFDLIGKQARVLDLSIPATTFATHLATAFIRVSEGWTPTNIPQGTPEEVKQAIDFISPLSTSTPSNYERAAACLSKIVRSGLVCYWPGKETPLYILAGAEGRRFGVREDECWALLGALELENVKPWYSTQAEQNNEDAMTKNMKKIKTQFFESLLKKYQWELLLVPYVEDQNALGKLSWPERTVRGGVLPLGIYFSKDIAPALPQLTYDEEKDELIIEFNKAEDGSISKEAKFCKLNKPVLCRSYTQAKLGQEGFIKVGCISEKGPGHLYFPLVDIPAPALNNDYKIGKRCVQIEPSEGGDNSGEFRGIVDLWGRDDEFAELSYSVFNIRRAKTLRRWERCVVV